jgi:hypothetical protein
MMVSLNQPNKNIPKISVMPHPDTPSNPPATLSQYTVPAILVGSLAAGLVSSEAYYKANLTPEITKSSQPPAPFSSDSFLKQLTGQQQEALLKIQASYVVGELAKPTHLQDKLAKRLSETEQESLVSSWMQGYQPPVEPGVEGG